MEEGRWQDMSIGPLVDLAAVKIEKEKDEGKHVLVQAISHHTKQYTCNLLVFAYNFKFHVQMRKEMGREKRL